MLEQIGKYRIESVLGHGAMGVVYRGMDASLDRPVAIKTIHPHLLSGPVGEELQKRFKTEATAAARCQHANIVTVYEIGQHDDMPYIAMEFVNGRGLDQIMKETPSLPLKRINAIFVGVCRGLHYAHQTGIVHRDVKPANIMVMPGDAIKLADFGIAKMPASDQTQIGLTLGTPSYMAPEQRAGGEIDARVDVFALGVVMFELLSLCSDLPKGSYQVKVIAALPPSPKLVADRTFPLGIANFLGQCLNPDPHQRYANIGKMLEGYKSTLQDMQAATSADATASSRSASSGTYAAADVTMSTRPAATPRPAPQPMKPPVEEPPTPEEERFIKKSLTSLEATRALKAVDPILNPDWQQRVAHALDQFDLKSRERAYTTILEPKNISWDSVSKKFTFLGQPSLRDVGASLTTPQLSTLAEKLARSIDAMQDSRVAMMIADMLEGGLAAIERFDTEDNITRQKEKHKLRQAFLYQAALCVQRLDFDAPENLRSLTVESIRTYILEVFIKQQVMKYWFSTTPVRELELDPNPLISKLVAHESKIRRFEIVKTDRFIFLIGSVPRFDQNQYSIRRFLMEDTAMGGRVYFFNVIVIDLQHASHPDFEIKLRHDISKMVSIERQLSVQIIELVDAFETYQRKYLLPLLFKPISADGTNLEVAIERRLLDYEKNLCRLALGKVPRALRQHVKGQDDFEYLFSGLKALLIELLGNVQDFSYLSTSMWSEKTHELEYRIAAYIRLLEKRNASLSTPTEDMSVKDAGALDPALPLNELKKAIGDSAPALEDLNVRFKEAVRQAAEEMSATQQFFNRLLKSKKETPEEVRKEIDDLRRNCYHAIVRIPKKYPKITVYLEFEDLAPANNQNRHYAFPAGEEGLGLLPILVQLPEKRDDFVPRKLQEVIEFDVFKATQQWDGGGQGAAG